MLEPKVDLYTVAIPPPRDRDDVGMISRQIHLVLIQQFSLRHLEHLEQLDKEQISHRIRGNWGLQYDKCKIKYDKC